MELEEIKSKWKSIEPHLEKIAPKIECGKNLKDRMDIKTGLVMRMALMSGFTFVCFALMATSGLWSPLKLPLEWLISFCTLIFVGGCFEAHIAYRVSKINLSHDTHTEILKSVVYIKQSYKRLEFLATVAVSVLLIWLMMIPPFINTGRMYFIGSLLLITLILEFIWYRNFTMNLTKLGIVEDEN